MACAEHVTLIAREVVCTSISTPHAMNERTAEKILLRKIRKNQASNRVTTNLRKILKAYGFRSKGKGYKDLILDVQNHNLLEQVAERDKAWMQDRGVVLPAPQLQASRTATSSPVPVQPHHLPTGMSVVPNQPPYGPHMGQFIQPNENQLTPQHGPPQIDQLAKPFQIGHHWESEPGVFDQDTVKARRIQCNSLVCFSDSRCKEDVRTLSSKDTLAILSSLQAKKFKYKMEFGGDGKDVYGFIAQEVREVCPDLVEETESGILTIRSLEIIPLLVDAVNQLNSTRHLPDPLASFAGLSLNSRGPTLLAFFVDNKLVVNDHALEVLKGIKGPVAVLGMSGSAKSGNSSLCNWLLQQQGEAGHFRTGSNTDFSTKGIWMSVPEEQTNGSYRIVLDSQGYDIGDNGTQLLCFLCLLSSTLVIGKKLVLTNTLFEQIGVIATVKDSLRGIKNNDLPALILLIRDAQLEHYTVAGRKATLKEYLEDFLNHGPNVLRPAREAIKCFQPRTLMELPRPKDTKFKDGLSLLRDAVTRYCVPKSLEGITGKEMDGNTFAQLVRTGADALNAMNLRVPTLAQRIRCEKVADKLLSEYDHKASFSQVLDEYGSRTKDIQDVPDEVKQDVMEGLQEQIQLTELKRAVDDLQNKYQQLKFHRAAM